MNQTANPPSSLYSDRATGEVFPDARAMVNAYITRLNERAGAHHGTLDDTGHVAIKRGSAKVSLSVLDDHGVLLLVAPVMSVPLARREDFYRRLLELSFIATSDAAFAIDEEKNEVCVRALRRLSGLDYEEFEDLVETVGKVADDWDEALAREFA